MTIRDEDIINVTPTRLSTTESLFVANVFKGLGTTMRHCFQNLGRGGRNKNTIWVVQYPEERRDDRPVEEGGRPRRHRILGRLPPAATNHPLPSAAASWTAWSSSARIG